MNEVEKSLWERDKYYRSYPAMRNITSLLRFRYYAFSNRDKPTFIEKAGKKIPIVHMNRYNRGHHHKEFFKTYDRFKFSEIKFLRLYLCLTTLKATFPVLSRFGDDRNKIKEYIIKNLNKYIDGYDMAWDFDLPEECDICSVKTEKDEFACECPKCHKRVTINDLARQVLEFVLFFDGYNVSYSITFSGQRGFHVRIPYLYIHPMIGKDFNRVMEFNKRVSIFYNTFYIDTYGGDTMKLFKLPYSVDGEAPNFYMVLPLTKEQLLNFDVNKMKFNYVRKSVKLINSKGDPRGMCMWNFESLNKQYQNTLDMVNDVEGW